MTIEFGQEVPPLKHILGADYARIREQRGDPLVGLPKYSPGPCIICGTPDSNCTGHSTNRLNSVQPVQQGG